MELLLIIRVCISNSATGRRHVAKRVNQVREFVSHAVLLEICNIVIGIIDTPFLEVPRENFGPVLAILTYRFRHVR